MRNVLDEMQENNLLKIHESSFWVTFFVLIFVIVVQFVMGASFKEILGELIVLFFLGSTVIVKCLKSGIWMSEYEPSHKMNFLISAIVSVVIALFSRTVHGNTGRACAGSGVLIVPERRWRNGCKGFWL